MRSKNTTIFTLDDQLLQVIEAGLHELPYKVAAPAIAELQRQYQAAHAAPEAGAPAAPAGEKKAAAKSVAGGPGPVKPK